MSTTEVYDTAFQPTKPISTPSLVIRGTNTSVEARTPPDQPGLDVQIPLKLDWLSASSDTLVIEEVLGVFAHNRYGIERTKPRNGFQMGFKICPDQSCLDDPLMLVFAGGSSQRGVISYERSGGSSMDAAQLLARLFGVEKFRATRLDVAADFDQEDFYLDAKCEVIAAVDNWRVRGRRPEVKEINDCASGNGNTLYVGSGQTHLFRLYEKGKQMKDKTRRNWVRAEAVLKSPDKLVQRKAFQMAVRGELMDIWCLTPYAAFSGIFFGAERDKLRIATPEKPTDLQASAEHFVHQYYNLMHKLVAVHAHGDWSQLGDIVQTLKAKLDPAEVKIQTITAGDETFGELQQREEQRQALEALFTSAFVRII